MTQNPYACSDNGCILKIKSIGGMGTNGGCKCLRLSMHPQERIMLRKGILWLKEQIESSSQPVDSYTLPGLSLTADPGSAICDACGQMTLNWMVVTTPQLSGVVMCQPNCKIDKNK
jgi:hypothetical protein